MNLRTLLIPASLSLGLVGITSAQVRFTGSYGQNFDSLANSGNPTWSNNATLPGWYAARTLDTTPLATTLLGVGSGTSDSGFIYSFGAAGSTERSLGAVCTPNSGDQAFAVRLVNASAATINALKIDFTGEQWRNGGNASAQRLNFGYKVGASSISESGYVDADALDFESLIHTTGASALDGNAAANRLAKSGALDGLNWGVGQELWLRWYDARLPNSARDNHGLAIDDLTIQTVPEPSGIVAMGVGALVVLRRRARR